MDCHDGVVNVLYQDEMCLDRIGGHLLVRNDSGGPQSKIIDDRALRGEKPADRVRSKRVGAEMIHRKHRFEVANFKSRYPKRIAAVAQRSVLIRRFILIFGKKLLLHLRSWMCLNESVLLSSDGLITLPLL